MSRTATPQDVIEGRALWCVHEGDAAVGAMLLPPGSIGAVVTDPPAGIGFMGKAWDGSKGGRIRWVAWLSTVLYLARRATRDGGRSLVWSLPRTSHWTGCAVEDAGWSIESTVTHLFGTGWPKGKSQLKPAAETWWLARNGRSEALNIEACRVGTQSTRQMGSGRSAAWEGGAMSGATTGSDAGRYPPNVVLSHSPGCVLEGVRKVRGDARQGGGTRPGGFGNVGSPSGCGTPNARGHADPDGTETVDAWRCVEGCPVRELDAQSGERTSGVGAVVRATARGHRGNAYGTHSREAGTPCVEYGDTGGASRFFPQFPADEFSLFGYVAKPSKREKDTGVRPAELPDPSEDGNDHPTVKSVALMRWLIRLVTEPGEVVLDLFAGSGTTGVGAIAEGRRVILVECDPRSAEIARQRCENAVEELSKAPRKARRNTPA